MPARRASALAVGLLCLVLAAVGIAGAVWTGLGSGSSRAAATSVGPATAPTASVSSRTVTLSWAGVSLASGRSVQAYEVKRYDSSGSVRQTIAGGTCASLVTGTSCTSTATPPGTWRFSAQPVQGNWRGAESGTTVATVGAPTLTTSPARIRPGAQVTGTVANLIAGETLRFRLGSPTGTVVPGTLDGAATPTPVGSSGGGSVTITVPSGTANGTYTLYAITSPSEDSATSSVAVEAPLDPPTISSGPSGPTQSTSASFAFSTPSAASYTCSLDGAAPTTCTSPRSYTGLAQGTHTFVVTAFSSTGMPSDPTTRTWTADTVAPSGTTTSPPTASTVNAAVYTAGCSTPSTGDLCGTATDGAAGSGVTKVEVAVMRDNGTKYYDGTGFGSNTPLWYVASGTTSWTFGLPAAHLSDTSYTVSVRVTDAVNLVGAVTQTGFTADFTAPTATVTAPTASGTYGPSTWSALCSTPAAEDFCGTASDLGSGISTVEWTMRQGTGSYWDGTSFAAATPVRFPATGTSSWSSAWPFTRFPADGGYTLTAFATDGAGNTSAGTAVTFRSDATAPTVATTFPTAGSTYSATTWNAGCSTPATGDVCGTAADGTGTLSRVEVSIQQGTGSWWNGSTWVATQTWLTATGTTSWSYGFAATSFPADGTFTVRARAVDTGSNVSAFSATTFDVDRTAPTVTLTGTPANPTTSTAATVTFTTNDAGATTTCRLDTGPTSSCTSPATWSGLADGAHTVQVTATDTVGNAGSASYTWTVDTTAPSLAVTFPAAGATTYGSSSYTAGCSTPSTGDVCGTASDAASGLASLRVSLRRSASGLWWDGAAFASASPVPFNPTGTASWTWPFAAASFGSDGSYELVAEASDAAGNPATVSRAFSVDVSTPPTPTITSSPPSPTTSRTASVSFSSAEPSVTFTCRLDAGTAAACTSPVTYSGLADGAHTVTVTASDAAGNTSGSASATWTVDGTAPAVTVATPSSGASYNAAGWTAGCSTPSTGDVCGTVSDGTGTGVAGVQLSLRQGSGSYWDGAAFGSSSEVLFTASVSGSAWTWPFDVASFPADGSYTLRVVPQDVLGNTASLSTSFSVDRAAPTAPSLDSGPTDPSASTAATFTFSGPEPGLTYTCTLDGSSASCTSPRSYSGLAQGSHTFAVSATDAAGNTGPSASRTWTVDTTAPASTTLFPAAATSYSRSSWDAGCSTAGGDVCGTATDDRSGVSDVAVSLRQVGTGLWWNGSAFAGSSEAYTAASGTTSWTWAFDSGNFPEAGDYAMTVRTRDAAGNAATASRTFAITSSISQVKASAAATSCNATTNTVAVPSGGFAVGNTVIARVAVRQPATGTVSISDTRGHAWTRDADVAYTGGTPSVRTVVFSTSVTTAMAAGDTISFTLPSNNGAVALAVEWSGIAATGRTDGTAGTGTGSATTVSAATTTTNPTDLVLGITGASGNVTLSSQAAGWSTSAGGTSTCGGNGVVTTLAAYRLPFTTGTFTYNPVLASATNHAEVVVAYKAQ